MIERIGDLDEPWAIRSHGPQLRAVRRAGERVRERFAAGPRCVSVRTLPISNLAYPSKFAFWAFALSPAPFVIMSHRCLLVQFMQNGELKTLLFNPTDVDGAKATPYLARLIAMSGERVTKMLTGTFERIEDQLARHALTTADIDYVAYDHFHTQDLRPILGTPGRPARFPNAKLLAPKLEWEDWADVHPLQRAWFVKDGREGVSQKNVILTEHDLMLGDGVMLLRTPGHTTGNQTLFLNTDSGVWGVSENGTSADNWSPLDSRITGLAASCKRGDVDVVLNANTPELAASQYTSMILERTIVDRVKRAPAFVQMFPSSEITPSLIAPGLTPTLLHKSITHGAIARPSKRAQSDEARAGA